MKRILISLMLAFLVLHVMPAQELLLRLGKTKLVMEEIEGDSPPHDTRVEVRYYTHEGKYRLISKHRGMVLSHRQLKEHRHGLYLLLGWKSLSRGEHLSMDLVFYDFKKKSIGLVPLRESDQYLPAGKTRLRLEKGRLFFEVMSRLEHYFRGDQTVYEIRSFLVNKTHLLGPRIATTAPKSAREHLNLAKFQAKKLSHKKAIGSYLNGLELIRQRELFVSVPLLSEIRLDLANSYLGLSQWTNARKVLEELVLYDFESSYSKKAQQILEDMASRN